jgi:hypothetical protein
MTPSPGHYVSFFNTASMARTRVDMYNTLARVVQRSVWEIYEHAFRGVSRWAIVGERTRLSKLRTRDQSRGIRPKGNHDRDCDMPELRLVRPDRNTSY